MNAQTEQLIYWKQRHDKLAEQHDKAICALKNLVNFEDSGELETLEDEAGGVFPMLVIAIAQARLALAAIEEPNDA